MATGLSDGDRIRVYLQKPPLCRDYKRTPGKSPHILKRFCRLRQATIIPHDDY